jgi:hypothetical protein
VGLAERGLEKRLVGGFAFPAWKSDLSAMNAVIAPADKNDPQDAIRPPEDWHEHSRFD